MKIATLKYHDTNNIGDEIQTLAAEQWLPHVDERFYRDTLALEKSEEDYLLLFNGWNAESPKNSFPPAGFFTPLIISFHIAKRKKGHYTSPESIAYFKKHEPIGCRDEETTRLLQEKGVNAYFSKCLTITFPTRTHAPQKPKVYVVNIPKHVRKLIPQELGPQEAVDQHINELGDLKFDIARKLLEKYRDEATLVVTSRLHCALPCVAMGIPVVLWANPKNKRLALAKKIGLTIYDSHPLINYNKKVSDQLNNYSIPSYLLKKLDRIAFKIKHGSGKNIDWNPKPLDIEDHKQELIGRIKQGIKKILEKKGEKQEV